MTRLDRGETQGPQFYVYFLKHAPAEDIARLLNETFGNSSTSSGSSGTSTTTPSSPFANALGSRPGPQQSDQTGPGASTNDQSPSAGLPESPVPFGGTANNNSTGDSGNDQNPRGVKIVANKNNNSLLIRATADVYESIESTLRRTRHSAIASID